MKPIHWSAKTAIVVMTVAVILVLGRLLLPGVVRDQLNARLDHMGPYHGHVDTVRLHLWRGAYSLHGMTIVKEGKAVPVPLFKGDVVEIEMSWSGLLHGGVVGRAAFDNPEINFVDNTGKGGSQTGEGHDWRAQLEALLPIKLDEVVVRNGVVTFRNFSSNPPVDLRITKLDATVKNLTNVAGKDGGRVADFTGKASVLGEAPLEMKGRFDPFGRPDTFELSLSIQQIDLTRINSLARAYAGVDIASGTGTFALELQANKGHVEGYAKPLFTDLKIFSWKQDVAPGNKNVVQLTYEALAGAVTELFTNQRNDQFGTRVPISGELGETQVGLVGAVYGIVRNAFVEAYKPGFDKLPPRPAKDEKK